MPFTRAQFFSVFERYNDAVWPMQWALYALALVAVVLALKSARARGRAISAILSALWLWMALAYHFAFFAAINPPALLFGSLFVVEAVLLARATVSRQPMTFRIRLDVAGMSGVMLIAYALVLYPLLSYVLGHRYPAAPTFGLPCPTTIFTFGLLLWAEQRVPLRLLVIPVAWSLLGVAAALSFGVLEDYGLLIAGLGGGSAILLKNRRIAKEATQAVSILPPVAQHISDGISSVC